MVICIYAVSIISRELLTLTVGLHIQPGFFHLVTLFANSLFSMFCQQPVINVLPILSMFCHYYQCFANITIFANIIIVLPILAMFCQQPIINVNANIINVLLILQYWLILLLFCQY
jgi:hypothetical protein